MPSVPQACHLTPDQYYRALREVITVLVCGDPADVLFAGQVDQGGLDLEMHPVFESLEDTLKIWLEFGKNHGTAERDLGIVAVVFLAVHNACGRPETAGDLSAYEDGMARRLLSLDLPAPWKSSTD